MQGGSTPLAAACAAAVAAAQPHAAGMSRFVGVSSFGRAPAFTWFASSAPLDITHTCFGAGDEGRAAAEAAIIEALAARGLPPAALERRVSGEGDAMAPVAVVPPPSDAGAASAGGGGGDDGGGTSSGARRVPTLPCRLCPKRFLSAEFLAAHVARRHPRQQRRVYDDAPSGGGGRKRARLVADARPLGGGAGAGAGGDDDAIPELWEEGSLAHRLSLGVRRAPPWRPGMLSRFVGITKGGLALSGANGVNTATVSNDGTSIRVKSHTLGLKERCFVGPDARQEAEAHLIAALAEHGLHESVLHRRDWQAEGGAQSSTAIDSLARAAPTGARRGGGAGVGRPSSRLPPPASSRLQCSLCPLQFLSPAVLQEHFALQHGDEQRQQQQVLLPPTRGARHATLPTSSAEGGGGDDAEAAAIALVAAAAEEEEGPVAVMPLSSGGGVRGRKAELPCRLCPKSFVSAGFLAAHVARRHPNALPQEPSEPPRRGSGRKRSASASVPQEEEEEEDEDEENEDEGGAAPLVDGGQKKRTRFARAAPPPAPSTSGGKGKGAPPGKGTSASGGGGGGGGSSGCAARCAFAANKARRWSGGMSRLVGVCNTSTGWCVQSTILKLKVTTGSGERGRLAAEALVIDALQERGLGEEVLYRRGWGDGGAGAGGEEEEDDVDD